MENPAPFDLNQALRQWRETLASSPAMRPEDCDELEGHLRDSIASLESKGLSAREAFWVARERMGHGESLLGEFGKLNVDQVWLNRALWMVLGSLGIGAVSALASAISNLATMGILGLPKLAAKLEFLGIHEAMAPDWMVGPVCALLHPIVLCGLLVAAWRSRSRANGWVARLTVRVTAHPISGSLKVILLLVALLAVNLAISTAMSIFVLSSMLPPSVVVHTSWRVWSMLFPAILWPVVLGWLLTRVARSKTACRQS